MPTPPVVHKVLELPDPDRGKRAKGRCGRWVRYPDRCAVDREDATGRLPGRNLCTKCWIPPRGPSYKLEEVKELAVAAGPDGVVSAAEILRIINYAHQRPKAA